MISPARRIRRHSLRPPPRVRAREVRLALALELPPDAVREIEAAELALEYSRERAERDRMYDDDPDWGPFPVTVWSCPGGPGWCVWPLRVPLIECVRVSWRGERRAA